MPPRNFTAVIPDNTEHGVAIDQALYEILSGTRFGAFSCISPEGLPWSWAAYFAFSADLALYLLSSPETRHSRYIRENDACSAVIMDSQQTDDGGRKGLQLLGTCALAAGDDIPEALAAFRNRFPVFKEALELETALEAAGWSSRMWLFRPTLIRVFHEPLLGPNEENIATVDFNPLPVV